MGLFIGLRVQVISKVVSSGEVRYRTSHVINTCNLEHLIRKKIGTHSTAAWLLVSESPPPPPRPK